MNANALARSVASTGSREDRNYAAILGLTGPDWARRSLAAVYSPAAEGEEEAAEEYTLPVAVHSCSSYSTDCTHTPSLGQG